MFLGILYLLRGLGDVAENILSYISPLGLIMRTAPFAYDNLWPILVVLGLSIIAIFAAFYLNSTRDLGAGLVAAKPGRKEASKFLQSPFTLALRLLKFTLIGWGITILILGLSYGSIFGDIENFLEGNEMLQQMFLHNDAFTFEEQFLTVIVSMYAIIITVPVLIVLLKVYSEEKKGRLEHIYSKKISRSHVLTNYLIISLASSIDFALLFTFGLWLAAFSVMAEPLSLITVLISGLVYLPAVWFMIGLTLLLIGFAPKLIKLIWFYIGASFVVVYLGDILQFPDWIEKLAPFGHISTYPVESINVIPLVVLTILSIVMGIVGFYGYNKRDI